MNKKSVLKNKVKQIAQDPKVKKAFVSMKPAKSIWGILGVIIFFFLPELIAYIWGIEITNYAKEELVLATSFFEEKYLEMLIMLFEDGMSWLNLLFGFILLGWLFF